MNAYIFLQNFTKLYDKLDKVTGQAS